jgi:hypothetical protein
LAENATEIEYKGKFDLPQNRISPLFVSDISKNPKLFETCETFCPVMGILPVDVSDVADFCRYATEYVNEKVWGNLSTTIFVAPSTLNSHQQIVRKMVDELRIGAIGVNIWGGTIVLFPHLHWGAYPGNTPEDIQSGIGRGVGNFFCYDKLKKAVLWSPFFHDFQQVSGTTPARAQKEAMRITDYNITQSFWSICKVASALYLGL